jgi:hypothetical protein
MQALITASLQDREQRELALRTTVARHLDLPAPPEGDRSGWPVFKAWCEQKDITPFPARPPAVAYFILENADLGIKELLRIVKSISLVHESVADPTAGGAVPAALNKIAPIPAPRSWPKAEKVRFRDLPYETQKYLSGRDFEINREIQQAKRDAAQARKDLAAIQQPTQVTNGTAQPLPAA